MSGRLRDQRDRATKSYYRDLFNCLRTIIDVFDYSYKRDRTVMATSWSRCFGVFYATSMLGIARLRQKIDVDTDNDRISTALGIFTALADTKQAPRVAQLAANSLHEILEGIGELDATPTGRTPGIVIATPEEASNEALLDASSRPSQVSSAVSSAASLKRVNISSLEDDARDSKRAKTDAEPAFDNVAPTSSTWDGGQYPQAMPYDQATNAPSQTAGFTQIVEQQPYPSKGSISSNEHFQFYEAGYTPIHPHNFDGHHLADHWVHASMIDGPPLYDEWGQACSLLGENMMDPNGRQTFRLSLQLPPRFEQRYAAMEVSLQTWGSV